MVSELELIRCAANVAPGPNDIKAAVGGSEVTGKVRSADVQRCVGRGRESDVGIDVPVLRGVAKGGVRIKAVIVLVVHARHSAHSIVRAAVVRHRVGLGQALTAAIVEIFGFDHEVGRRPGIQRRYGEQREAEASGQERIDGRALHNVAR